jgi:hypothetical protein
MSQENILIKYGKSQGCLQSLFRQVKEQKDEHSVEEIESFDKKKSYLETLREYQLTGDHKTDLDAIKLHIETWKILEKFLSKKTSKEIQQNSGCLI